tara:strand:+ start:47 stop:766 length:720 start_codon:yes stop_codon:yes gene_type:complete
MNEDISNRQDIFRFLLDSNVEISLSNFIIALILSGALSLVVKYVYIKVSSSLNDKEHFSETFVPLAIITTLVITVIKFSLALSLGLVGALSIVRFRAAIKEPEELVYLFLIIAIGLANGANQFMVSIIATFTIVIILYTRKLYNDKKKTNNFSNISTNIIQINIKKGSKTFEEIIDKIKDKVEYIKLKSLSTNDEDLQYNLWFDANKKEFSNLIKEIEKINTEDKNVSIQIYSRSGIYE